MRGAGRIDEAHRQAVGAGAPGAADAVGVVGGGARQVVVDHHRQLRDVQPARGHVGGDQHLQLAAPEAGQRLVAAALAQFAVERLRRHAGLVQFLGQVVGAALAGHEHQRLRPGLAAQQVPQQRGALRAVHFDRTLADRRRDRGGGVFADAPRSAQQALRQPFHRGREGGREQQCLPAPRQQRQDPAQFGFEAQRQQAVGLVQHQRAHCAQVECVVCGQVEQATRRGHDDVGTAAQLQHLRIDRGAAGDRGHLDAAR